MDRRHALPLAAVALALLLAGCAHPAGSLEMTRVNDSELAERASYETTGADRYPDISIQRTARALIANGSLTIPAARQPLRTDLTYASQGAYYNVSASVIDTVPGAVILAEIDFDPTDPTGTSLAFQDLSSADRTHLEPILSTPPSDRRSGPEATLPLAFTTDERDSSVLLDHGGSSVVVTFDGDTYQLNLSTVNQDELRVYRYQATRIAASTTAFARHLKQSYAFTLSGLSDGERNVIETAIEEGYFPGSTDDGAFGSIVDRFERHRAVDDDGGSGSWLVRYDGHLYWAQLDAGAFVGSVSSVTSPGVTPH